MKILHSLWKGLWGQAYLLLVLTTLMWAGNGIAGRLAVDQVSPMVLTCLRWVIVVAILTPLVGRQVVAEWPQLKERWLFTTLMGIFGLTAFNALFYAAAHHTSAINLTLLPGFDPGLRACRMVLFFRARVIPLQIIGMIVTLIGVIDRVREGRLADPEDSRPQYRRRVDADRLRVLFGLHPRPALPPGRSGPRVLRRHRGRGLRQLPASGRDGARSGHGAVPDPEGLAHPALCRALPSLLSQIFFIRGVELIGPARAGLFVNLVPVFGALLAVMLLGEPFALYHAMRPCARARRHLAAERKR